MDLKEFEDIVENMILQLSYPGFDSRSLNLALPMTANDAPVKLYVQALNSESVNVQLSALRWFQARAGAAKHHYKSVAKLLDNKDSWVRKEATKTLEIAKCIDPEVVSNICALLQDEEQIVRIEAARTLGNLAKELPIGKKSLDAIALKDTIINALRGVIEDPIPEVSRKAIKALRKLGAFSAS
jgi:hypothetical protein